MRRLLEAKLCHVGGPRATGRTVGLDVLVGPPAGELGRRADVDWGTHVWPRAHDTARVHPVGAEVGDGETASKVETLRSTIRQERCAGTCRQDHIDNESSP